MIDEGELHIVFLRSENNPADILTKNVKEQIFTRLSGPVLSGKILELLEHGNEENVKHIASMAIMSHKDCGLNYSALSQMVCSHVKKLANEIDGLDQSEDGLHQQKGNMMNRFSKCDEWD